MGTVAGGAATGCDRPMQMRSLFGAIAVAARAKAGQVFLAQKRPVRSAMRIVAGKALAILNRLVHDLADSAAGRHMAEIAQRIVFVAKLEGVLLLVVVDVAGIAC